MITNRLLNHNTPTEGELTSERGFRLTFYPREG